MSITRQGDRPRHPEPWVVSSPLLSWAAPLACTVLSYGLAGGIWKQADLGTAQFCILLVAVKGVLNTFTWVGLGRPPLVGGRFLAWAMAGQLFNGVAWIAYFRALEVGPAALVQTITSGYTALAAVLALVFLKERLAAIQLLGVALAIAATLMLGGGSAGQSLELSGWFAYSLLTVLCWAVAVTFFKQAYLQPGANDTTFFMINALGMALTMLPYGLAGQPQWTGALGLGFFIVFLYALGDLTLFAAIHRGPAAIVSPLSGLYPVPTLLYAAVILHEPITRLQWTATAMVLAAIVLVVPAQENPVLVWLKARQAQHLKEE